MYPFQVNNVNSVNKVHNSPSEKKYRTAFRFCFFFAIVYRMIVKLIAYGETVTGGRCVKQFQISCSFILLVLNFRIQHLGAKSLAFQNLLNNSKCIMFVYINIFQYLCIIIQQRVFA